MKLRFGVPMLEISDRVLADEIADYVANAVAQQGAAKMNLETILTLTRNAASLKRLAAQERAQVEHFVALAFFAAAALSADERQALCEQT